MQSARDSLAGPEQTVMCTLEAADAAIPPSCDTGSPAPPALTWYRGNCKTKNKMIITLRYYNFISLLHCFKAVGRRPSALAEELPLSDIYPILLVLRLRSHLVPPFFAPHFHTLP